MTDPLDRSERAARTVALLIIGAAFTVLCAPVAYEVTMLLRDLRAHLSSITSEVQGWDVPVKHTLADASAASLVVAQIGAKERNDFDAQQLYYKSLTTKSGALIDSITSVAEAVHDRTLPRVDLVVADSDAAIRDTNARAALILGGINTEVQKTGTLTDAITVRVQDPQYDRILADAAVSMSSLRAGMADTAATVADARKLADYEVAEVMKPVKKAELVAHFIVRGIGWFFGY